MTKSEQARAVTFTRAEARALVRAAGEIMDHPDIVQQSFPNGSTRAAAWRAYGKLQAVAYRAVPALRG